MPHPDGVTMEDIEAGMVAMAASWRSAYRTDEPLEAVLPAHIYDQRTEQQWEDARQRIGVKVVRRPDDGAS